jgi:FkbH-like protein
MAAAEQELDGLVEGFLSSPADARGKAFADMVRALNGAIKDARFDAAAGALRRAVLPDLDCTQAQSLCQVLDRVRARHTPLKQGLRLALLGSFTTRPLRSFVELHLFGAGVAAEVYESDYGVFRQEILDPASGLYNFKPQNVYIATGWRDLGHRPALRDARGEVERCVGAEVADWSSLWRAVHDRLGCPILQDNFAPPPWRILGNHEARHPAGLARYIAAVNGALQDNAPPYVTIHDVDHLSASWGRWAWADERFFFQAKLPCAPDYLVDYAHSVASILAAQRGLGKKCIALDLDNTLWGGVIGDDGLKGIALGQGTPRGEAYTAFQQYVRDLKARGIILAVCSKNDEGIAKEVFEKHPEMVLRLEDVSCFVANWGDKARNLRTIAERLNIGLDSIVLVDDNPAERSLVRQSAPEVAVPEMPKDPAGYVAALERHRYFQIMSAGEEDFQRTDYYRANVQRQEVEAAATSTEEFLTSLQMVARVAPITSVTMERCVQLINRTNQFNLTTRRYSAADVQRMMESQDWLTCTVALADRFGDNGLISVLLGRAEGNVLEIDTWLMSCRVLKRRVEHFLMNRLHDLALRGGFAVIRGRYIPTARNSLVRDLYAELGFTRTGTGTDGSTCWELPTSGNRQPLEAFIREENEPAA